jgi:hypothetical protein
MLYLQGGAILPIGLPYNHVGEAKLQDELTLIVALDKEGTYFSPLLSKRKPPIFFTLVCKKKCS